MVSPWVTFVSLLTSHTPPSPSKRFCVLPNYHHFGGFHKAREASVEIPPMQLTIGSIQIFDSPTRHPPRSMHPPRNDARPCLLLRFMPGGRIFALPSS